jgi:RNA polymerase sigma-70 factor (ECF subfamily)
VDTAEPDLKALMLRARDGDAAAYRLLLTGLRDRLRVYFARRLAADPAQAEDLVQETLMAIHAKRATYDPGQPVTPWVYAIARYKLIDHFRRTRPGRWRAIAHDDEFAIDDDSATVETRHDLERGLSQLSPATRDLVERVKLREEPVAEVARRAGMSESAVKVAVHRAVARLSARFRSGGGGA